MARAVNPAISIGAIGDIYDINYLWGFTSAGLIYTGLSYIWPARETLVDATICDETKFIDGVECYNEGVSTPTEVKEGGSGEMKDDGLVSAEEVYSA